MKYTQSIKFTLLIAALMLAGNVTAQESAQPLDDQYGVDQPQRRKFEEKC